MHKQAEAFLNGEGDAWHARNKDKPRLPDPVLEAIEACGIKPKNVLEIGCGDGWRLAEIKLRYGANVEGYEISERAIKHKLVDDIWYGAASDLLDTPDDWCDLLIFGFCLYVVDREDLLTIVGDADRILKDGGHLIIHDFLPPERPYKVKYKHKDGLFSYHMDYAQLWLAHPGYRHLNTIDAGEKGWVKVLKKDYANAFPLREI